VLRSVVFNRIYAYRDLESAVDHGLRAFSCAAEDAELSPN